MSKRVTRTLQVGVLALALGAAPAMTHAVLAQEPPQATAESGLSDGARAGIGCLATAGIMTGGALMVGPSETLMLVAGGVLAPGSAKTMMFGLLSTLVAATCSLGAAATPSVLWAWEQQDNIVDGFAAGVGSLGTTVVSALGFGAPPRAELAEGQSAR